MSQVWGVGSNTNPLSTYTAMVKSREIDLIEQRLVSSGKAFFHVSGAGHEATSLIAEYLGNEDWLHLHYRDKALMLACGVTAEQFFHSLLCNTQSHSSGRQMSAHMSAPANRILSLVGPVGNNALQAVGVAAHLQTKPDANQIVICSVGDGSSQQGEFLEAIAEAVRECLPVLFLIADNAYAISTKTARRTFFDLPNELPEHFYGMPILRVDGRSPNLCRKPLAEAIGRMRQGSGPAIAVMRTDRLDHHTNADDQTSYRDALDLTQCRESGDPLVNERRYLLESGVSESDLSEIERDIKMRVCHAADLAQEAACHRASLVSDNTRIQRPEKRGGDTPSLTMLTAIRDTLQYHLQQDPRVTLFGQDIEDPKGDVFGVTRGLSTAFPGRVTNAPLSESTIVGKSIGRALAGGRPVAFLQFADFVPLAFNQIISELGSMHWRTNGGWTCPVIIMAPCGGYRPGLGPFHAQTMESILAHVPGIDIVMPSHATDAAGLLNAAFASERPTVFLYPKICLNDRDRITSADVARQFVPIGSARHLMRGDDLTIVTYGSTIFQCEQAAATLAEHGVGVDLIDLRSIQPWDRDAIFSSARCTGRILVVHEDNLSCSVASEIVASVAESVAADVKVRRVTRPDVYVPCNFEDQLDTLPSYRHVLDTACDLLGIEIAWQPTRIDSEDGITIKAQGSSPADEAVTVSEWHVKVGDTVQVGDHLADLEADKAVFEFRSPHAGRIVDLLAELNTEIRVGKPLLRLQNASQKHVFKPKVREESGTPFLTGRPQRKASHASRSVNVTISQPFAVQGGRVVSNDELVVGFPGRTSEQIEQLTGIHSRRWVREGENALSLAVEASRLALTTHNLTLADLGAIVVSTTTPMAASPSMACMLLRELAHGKDIDMPAHDVSAACTGYLYALSAGYDFIQASPDKRVLVVTTEVLSPLLNLQDFDTAILFGDAATATILGIDGDRSLGRLHRPVLSAKPDLKGALRVGLHGIRQSGSNVPGDPHSGDALVEMDGKPVFGQAIRSMKAVLLEACRAASMELDELGLVVPHQANSRIMAAVADRLKAPPGLVLDTIAETGNTSSSSIPMALARADLKSEKPTGLCAFGGGFTFGAAIIHGDEKDHL